MENPVPGPAYMQQHSKAHKNLAIKGERLNAPSVHSHNSVTTDQSAHDSQTSITNLDNAPLKMELKEIPNDKTRKLSDMKLIQTLSLKILYIVAKRTLVQYHHSYHSYNIK